MTRSANDGRAPTYGSDDRAGFSTAANEGTASRSDRVDPRAAERASPPGGGPPPRPGAIPSKGGQSPRSPGAQLPATPGVSGGAPQRPQAPPIVFPPVAPTSPGVAPIPPAAPAAPTAPAAAGPAAPPPAPAAAVVQVPAPAPDATERSASAPSPVAGGSERRLRGTTSQGSEKSDRLLGVEEIDARLAALEQPQGGPLPGGKLPTDLAEVRALFTQLATNHVRPVRDFMLDLRSGDASIDWLPICEPALRSLRRAAAKLGLVEMCASLDRFGEALSRLQKSGAQSVGGDDRRALLTLYEELGGTMPQAFALERDRNERESVILHSLLLQVAGVRKITFDKLVAAGLWTLEAMFLATPDDVAATTGIDRELAQRIVDRFRAYRVEVRSTPPDATRARERQRIADLTSRLRREHGDYESASKSWTREAQSAKKELRCVRARTMLDIRVELARLGEVEWLARIERLPFEKKIEELDVFLNKARDKYGAQPGG